MHRYADCYIAWLLKTAEPAKGCSEVVVSPWEEVGKQQKFSKILCFFCPRSLISHFESFLTPPRWLRWPTEWKLQSNEAKSAANELVEIQFSTLITLGIVCEEWQCHWAEFSPKRRIFQISCETMELTCFRQTCSKRQPKFTVICKLSCQGYQWVDGPASQVPLESWMLQGLLILQMFPPKHMIFLFCSFELTFVQHP